MRLTYRVIELVLAQTAQIEAQSVRIEELTQRVAELEAKLGQPPKTPDNCNAHYTAVCKRDEQDKAAGARRGRRPCGRLVHWN
jgi:phage-related minor tail protein